MNFNIEKYLLGEMDGHELREFEAAMQSNPDFKKEVEIQRLIIKDLQTSSLSRKIKGIQKKQSRQERIKWIILLIALFTIPLIFLLIKTNKIFSPDLREINNLKKDSIPAQNHENNNFNQIHKDVIHPDSLNVPKEYLDQKSNQIDTIQNRQTKLKPDFAKKDRSESKRNLNSDPTRSNPEYLVAIAIREYTVPDDLAYLRSMDPDNVLDSIRYFLNVEKYDAGLRMLLRSELKANDLKFWTAHFNFKQGRYAESILQFNKIKTNELPQDKRDQIDWYLFLCFLASGNSQLENVNMIFEKVNKQSKHLYKKKMKNIMTEIDRDKK